MIEVSSPHARGWPHGSYLDAAVEEVVPAHAGWTSYQSGIRLAGPAIRVHDALRLAIMAIRTAVVADDPEPRRRGRAQG